MNLVDSSGWLAYFGNERNADYFAEPILDTEKLLVSTINLYEVFKRVYQQRGEDMALRAITAMLQGKIIDVTETISIQAAKFSADNKVGMADSLIYQTARMHKATLWTQDIDLAPFENVNYRAK